MRKNKPKMGTRLVPSIENLEGCHNWGGKWSRKDRFCYRENDDGSGCTAPHKGIEFCWDALERDHQDPESDERVTGYKPEIIGRIHGSDKYGIVDGSFFDSWNMYTDYPDEDAETRTEAIDIAKEWAFEEFWKVRNGPCFNPRGKRIDCEQPNAIACPDPSIIIDYYQDILYGEKPLINEYKSWLGYRPRITEKRFKHTNQIKID